MACVQVAPELVEVKIPPLATTATNLLPSADEAAIAQFAPGALVNVQIAPEFVEMYIEPLEPPFTAISLVPSAEEATPTQ